jgi:hypothetical protein
MLNYSLEKRSRDSQALFFCAVVHDIMEPEARSKTVRQKDSIGSMSRSIGSSKQFSDRRRLGVHLIAGKVIAKCAAIQDRSLIGSPWTAGDARGESPQWQVKPECFIEAGGA